MLFSDKNKIFERGRFRPVPKFDAQTMLKRRVEVGVGRKEWGGEEWERVVGGIGGRGGGGEPTLRSFAKSRAFQGLPVFV